MVDDDDMQVSVLVYSTQNLGDHGRDTVTAVTYDPDETVEALVRRAFPSLGVKYLRHDPTDFIALRVVVGTEPQFDESEAPF